ncbi:MAG: hypothetical protein Kow0029_15940 [Candidatus Rifleibacteriota bacterium]
MVELELENGLKLISDNDGFITLFAPDLEGKTARFKITGNGYSTGQRDFWGEESFTTTIQAGKFEKCYLKRTQLAQRLYRITGASRYNHTILAGKKPRFETSDLLPGGVIGQDSVITVPWKNRLWNFYGDTLGLSGFNFSASCARLPFSDKMHPSFDPDIGLPLEYLVDENGFAKKMIETGKKGFTWIEYVLPVKLFANSKSKSLLARYVLHSSLEKAEEAGFALFQESEGSFRIVKRFKTSKGHKCTHPVPIFIGSERRYLLFPWEMTGVEYSEIVNEQEHFFYTCFRKMDSKAKRTKGFLLNGEKCYIERDSKGRAIYSWRKGGVAASSLFQQILLQKGVMTEDDVLFAPLEIDSGKRIARFDGSIAYNSFKGCWICISQGIKPGDIIYAEADTPTGPWGFARKVSEFKRYNLYNPAQHPWFAQENDRFIYYEGTYTNFFSDSPGKNPEADYNQVMFKLDLAQEDLIMPIPVYVVRFSENVSVLLTGKDLYAKNLWDKVQEIAFFAFPENAKNADLREIALSDTVGSRFKVLADKPETKWGKTWISENIESKSFLEMTRRLGFEAGNFDGLVIESPVRARTISPEIKSAVWE